MLELLFEKPAFTHEKSRPNGQTSDVKESD
jgi:hypothetical protein